MPHTVRSEPVGPGFVRVVLTGADETLGRTFTPMGYDQWLRLFLPARPGHPPLLPDGPNEGWYTRWLALDEQERAVCRNYTVREARRLEGGFVLADLLLDLPAVGACIGPGMGEVFGLERRIGSQQVGLVHSEPPSTPGARSMPGNALPKSLTTHSSSCAFSSCVMPDSRF